MNHQVEHHGHIRAPGAKGRQALRFDEERSVDVRGSGPERAVEPLHMPRLHHDARLGGRGQDAIRGFERGCDGLLDQNVNTVFGRRERHPFVGRSGHRHHQGIDIRQQLPQTAGRLKPEFP